jgi:hypothetical protein
MAASTGGVGGGVGNARRRRVWVAEEATCDDGRCRSALPRLLPRQCRPCCSSQPYLLHHSLLSLGMGLRHGVNEDGVPQAVRRHGMVKCSGHGRRETD